MDDSDGVGDPLLSRTLADVSAAEPVDALVGAVAEGAEPKVLLPCANSGEADVGVVSVYAILNGIVSMMRGLLLTNI